MKIGTQVYLVMYFSMMMAKKICLLFYALFLTPTIEPSFSQYAE